jgi:hypothetical protein
MPAKLGAAGRKLWRELVGEYVFEVREVALLEACARQADDVALLEKVLRSDGPIGVGSRGQPKLTPVVGELRQGRLALARLLGELGLPAEEAEDAPTTARSARARHAADVRWAAAAARKARRGA